MEALQAGLFFQQLFEAMAIQAEIEAMKTANTQYPEDKPYSEEAFREKAQYLWGLSKRAREISC